MFTTGGLDGATEEGLGVACDPTTAKPAAVCLDISLETGFETGFGSVVWSATVWSSCLLSESILIRFWLLNPYLFTFQVFKSKFCIQETKPLMQAFDTIFNFKITFIHS